MPLLCDDCDVEIFDRAAIYCGVCDSKFYDEKDKLEAENEALHERIAELEQELAGYITDPKVSFTK